MAMKSKDLTFLPAADRAEVARQMDGKVVSPAAQHQSHTPGRMNKWEALYADRLRIRVAAGEVLLYWFEAVKFRLAEGCWYCPDFLVLLASGQWEVHEVKGFWREDAKVKVKVMAESFPFPLIIVSKGTGMAQWQYETVNARLNPFKGDRT